MQMNLFERETRAPPHNQRQTRRLGFNTLRNPCGIPDGRGKYPYEKFHRTVGKICNSTKYGDTARVKFFDLLVSMDATLFSQIIEIGVLWNKLSVSDQLDYEDAIGLRG